MTVGLPCFTVDPPSRYFLVQHGARLKTREGGEGRRQQPRFPSTLARSLARCPLPPSLPRSLRLPLDVHGHCTASPASAVSTTDMRTDGRGNNNNNERMGVGGED